MSIIMPKPRKNKLHRKTKFKSQVGDEDPFSNAIMFITKMFISICCIGFGIYALSTPQMAIELSLQSDQNLDQFIAHVMQCMSTIIVCSGVINAFMKPSKISFLGILPFIVTAMGLNLKYQYIDPNFKNFGFIDMMFTPFLMTCAAICIAGYFIRDIEDEFQHPRSDRPKAMSFFRTFGYLIVVIAVCCFGFKAENGIQQWVWSLGCSVQKPGVILIQYFMLSLAIYSILASDVIFRIFFAKSFALQPLLGTQKEKGNIQTSQPLKTVDNKKVEELDLTTSSNFEKIPTGLKLRKKNTRAASMVSEGSEEAITPTKGASFRRKKKTQ
mmetsp:Transcript_13842/g.18050  ORF Transcript_13842/g.18050 Transcript_13842/m.18050 type:complete len:327 (+) Transcript_13842:208-1188(+)